MRKRTEQRGAYLNNRIGRKLRSEKGASITFALLIFLVCAVVSSVVVVAATSAAGRMSRMAETDQRYYSVTSAAELIEDMFRDKTVTVVREEVSETEHTYSASSGTVTTGPEVPKTDTTTIKTDGTEEARLTTTYKPDGTIEKTEPEDINASILTDAAFRSAATLKDAASRPAATSEVKPGTDPYYDPGAGWLKRTMTMKIGNIESCVVMITEEVISIVQNEKQEIVEPGTIRVTVCNAEKNDDTGEYEEADDKYQLTLTFVADTKIMPSISMPPSSRSVDGAPYNFAEDGSYSYKTTTTKTRETTMKWRLVSIE